MYTRMKEEFPELYTQHGKVRKAAPKKYKCDCGSTKVKVKMDSLGGIKYGVPTCEECGKGAKETTTYKVWTRLVNGQMEQEDFILDLVNERGAIQKEDVYKELMNKYKDKTVRESLGYLAYFGYIQVDIKKMNEEKVVEYSINTNLNNQKRYDRIK